jgi:hypothetical protein
MIRAELHRFMSDPKQTLGSLVFYRNDDPELMLATIELPWRDNKRSLSCVPEGDYTVVKRYSEKYGDHWHLIDVPGRSHILIHHGNFHYQIQGCVLVGAEHKDIDGNGLPDVIASKRAMDEINRLMADQDDFQLKIFS